MDALMSEYGWTYEYTLRFPIAAGTILLMRVAERHGTEYGNNFVEKAITRARREMKRWLFANYEIV